MHVALTALGWRRTNSASSNQQAEYAHDEDFGKDRHFPVHSRKNDLGEFGGGLQTDDPIALGEAKLLLSIGVAIGRRLGRLRPTSCAQA